MSASPEFDVLITQLEKRERLSRWRTVIYTLVVTVLAAVFVGVTVRRIDQQQIELGNKQSEINEQQNKIELDKRQHEIELGKKQHAIDAARLEELKRQVTEFLLGPAQAYVRPAKFAGEIVVAKDNESAKAILSRFDSSEEASIRTRAVSQSLEDIRNLVNAPSDWASKRHNLELAGLELAGVCGRAWKADSRKLGLDTQREFGTMLYGRAIQITNEIAGAQQYEGTVELRPKFWSLYWGELPLIETEEVARAMIGFGKVLREWTKGQPAPTQDLQKWANEVKVACSRALEQ
jgi:hypothetical protein